MTTVDCCLHVNDYDDRYDQYQWDMDIENNYGSLFESHRITEFYGNRVDENFVYDCIDEDNEYNNSVEDAFSKDLKLRHYISKDDECLICFTRFGESKKNSYITTCCGKPFHKSCIVKWISINCKLECPHCKQNLGNVAMDPPLYAEQYIGKRYSWSAYEPSHFICDVSDHFMYKYCSKVNVYI